MNNRQEYSSPPPYPDHRYNIDSQRHSGWYTIAGLPGLRHSSLVFDEPNSWRGTPTFTVGESIHADSLVRALQNVYMIVNEIKDGTKSPNQAEDAIEAAMKEAEAAQPGNPSEEDEQLFSLVSFLRKHDVRKYYMPQKHGLARLSPNIIRFLQDNKKHSPHDIHHAIDIAYGHTSWPQIRGASIARARRAVDEARAARAVAGRAHSRSHKARRSGARRSHKARRSGARRSGTRRSGARRSGARRSGTRRSGTRRSGGGKGRLTKFARTFARKKRPNRKKRMQEREARMDEVAELLELAKNNKKELERQIKKRQKLREEGVRFGEKDRIGPLENNINQSITKLEIQLRKLANAPTKHGIFTPKLPADPKTMDIRAREVEGDKKKLAEVVEGTKNMESLQKMENAMSKYNTAANTFTAPGVTAVAKTITDLAERWVPNIQPKA